MTTLLIFEPHHGFGGNDPDGEPWPYGYISEGHGSPIFELGVPVVAPDCPRLLPLAFKMTAAEDMFHALERCRETFDRYVGLHMAKQPPDMDKAAANQEMVELCDAALSRARGEA